MITDSSFVNLKEEISFLAHRFLLVMITANSFMLIRFHVMEIGLVVHENFNSYLVLVSQSLFLIGVLIAGVLVVGDLEAGVMEVGALEAGALVFLVVLLLLVVLLPQVEAGALVEALTEV